MDSSTKGGKLSKKYLKLRNFMKTLRNRHDSKKKHKIATKTTR